MSENIALDHTPLEASSPMSCASTSGRTCRKRVAAHLSNAAVPLRQPGHQLPPRPREVVLERTMIRTLKLQHDPAVELRLLQIAAERGPVEEPVSRRQMIVESPVMIVGMNVRESPAGDFDKTEPLMAQRGVACVETDGHR